MKIPTIHQTDLFHHHADPDDHWDLACQFALAYMGELDLKGILLDFPPDLFEYGDPAIQAIHQLNYITGLAVPAGIGASKEQIIDLQVKENVNISGVNMVLKILKESQEPVVIHIVGSCRDVAIAGTMEPELFREKCKAIYLNAGSGKNGEQLEYNVGLDPISYSTIFRFPCPVYWMPCFEEVKAPFEVGKYGTFYKFRQGEILPYFSDKVQKYFAYALGRVADYKWLTYLEMEKNQTMIDHFGKLYRNMWCTGGFLHAVGKTVTRDGEILPLSTPGVDSVFAFEPITVSCDKDGITSWSLTDEPTDRFIFVVKDLDNYEQAMTKAMRTLLKNLP
ncbi:MAG: hypothetical protein ACOX6S_10710 [Clostridia bacterium]|jgi:hypothetical protein